MTSNPYESPDDWSRVPELKKRSGFPVFRLVVGVGILGLLAALFFPVTRNGGAGSAKRTRCLNNLKQITSAIHNYAEMHHAFPPAFTTDADGKRLHSWRTLILPFLEEHELYSSIDLSKPWNDPANVNAFKTLPELFRCPAADLPSGCTAYMAIVAPNSCMRPNEPRKFSEITDDTHNTLMIIEMPAEHAVHWMAPEDANEQMVLDLSAAENLPHTGIVNAAFVDGSVRPLSAGMTFEERLALISIAGNDNSQLDY